MTCVVGFIADGVYIGADSFVGTHYHQSKVMDPKVFKKGDFIIGGSGCLKVLRLMEHALEIPKHPKNISVSKYMTVFFSNAVRDCLQENLHKEVENAMGDGEILIGYKNRLFYMGFDYLVSEIKEPYMAIGAGADYAYGALSILSKDKKIKPRMKVRKALEASEELSPLVCGPHTILRKN